MCRDGVSPAVPRAAAWASRIPGLAWLPEPQAQKADNLGRPQQRAKSEGCELNGVLWVAWSLCTCACGPTDPQRVHAGYKNVVLGEI